MPHRIEMTSATVATGAATSFAWLPTVEDIVGMATHPFWGEFLPFAGCAWLGIQAGFYLYDRATRDPNK